MFMQIKNERKRHAKCPIYQDNHMYIMTNTFDSLVWMHIQSAVLFSLIAVLRSV